MKVTLHPGAEKDIEEAAAFYEREGSGVLAARFVAEFKRLARLAVTSIMLVPVVHRALHRFHWAGERGR